jgi:hypothetical protein
MQPPKKMPANWRPLASGHDGDDFLRELHREYVPGHILHGISLRAIATGDLDNVLFELMDGSGRFAAVHLSHAKESDPHWPDTKVYDDWAHFERDGADF